MTDELKMDIVIEDYDDMRVSEILPLLPELYDDELDIVYAHEKMTLARPEILTKIHTLRSSLPAPVPQPPTECQEKLCREPNSAPGSYYCAVHEITSKGTSDHGTAQLLANILIELRKTNEKLDDLAVQLEIERIRRDTHADQQADARPDSNAR
jgi:hypothetical protein